MSTKKEFLIKGTLEKSKAASAAAESTAARRVGRTAASAASAIIRRTGDASGCDKGVD